MVHIVMILDESGSMSPIRTDIIKSVNEFITQQKNLNQDECTFTFVTFSDTVKTTVLKKQIKNAQLITEASYKPTGCTALFKAIVDTITIFENDSDVLMVIVTDGCENASGKDYTKERVFEMVTKHKNQNGWNFIYLSADIDTFGQGTNLGFGNDGFVTKEGMTSYNSSGCNNVMSGYSNLSANISKTCSRVVSDMRTNIK